MYIDNLKAASVPFFSKDLKSKNYIFYYYKLHYVKAFFELEKLIAHWLEK